MPLTVAVELFQTSDFFSVTLAEVMFGFFLFLRSVFFKISTSPLYHIGKPNTYVIWKKRGDHRGEKQTKISHSWVIVKTYMGYLYLSVQHNLGVIQCTFLKMLKTKKKLALEQME